MEQHEKPLWGPWSNSPKAMAERREMLRSLATLVYVMAHQSANDIRLELVVALRRGEYSLVEMERARLLFDKLPTLTQRHIISTFNSINYRDDRQWCGPELQSSK